jgi:hypothetical protein
MDRLHYRQNNDPSSDRTNDVDLLDRDFNAAAHVESVDVAAPGATISR